MNLVKLGGIRNSINNNILWMKYLFACEYKKEVTKLE